MVNLIVQSLNDLLDQNNDIVNINEEFKKIKLLILDHNFKLIIWGKSYAFEDNFFQQNLIANFNEDLQLSYNKIINNAKQRSLSLFYQLDRNIICCLHKEKLTDRLLINLIENFNLKN